MLYMPKFTILNYLSIDIWFYIGKNDAKLKIKLIPVCIFSVFGPKQSYSYPIFTHEVPKFRAFNKLSDDINHDAIKNF